MKHQADLDKGSNASPELREAFRSHIYPLSDNAKIDPITAGQQWQIQDPDRKTVFDQTPRYRVERTEESLDVYDAVAEEKRASTKL